jgi:hypothetical protein
MEKRSGMVQEGVVNIDPKQATLGEALLFHQLHLIEHKTKIKTQNLSFYSLTQHHTRCSTFFLFSRFRSLKSLFLFFFTELNSTMFWN